MKFSEMTQAERRHLFETGTPAQVLKLAVWDIQEAEKNGHNIDMSVWIMRDTADFSKNCTVCLAGSILINQYDDEFLKAGFSENEYVFSYYDFTMNTVNSRNILNRLDFVDSCRTRCLHYIDSEETNRLWLDRKNLWVSMFKEQIVITTEYYHANKQKCLNYWTRLAELFEKYNLNWSF